MIPPYFILPSALASQRQGIKLLLELGEIDKGNIKEKRRMREMGMGVIIDFQR